MSLFIKVIDNQIIDHPVLFKNLQMIYPEITTNNPPENYFPFNRTIPPAKPDPYTVNEVEYVISSGVVNEVYTQRTMTLEEKQALWQQMTATRPFPSWTIDTDTCIWQPPVAYPDDGQKYQWDEDAQMWQEIIL